MDFDLLPPEVAAALDCQDVDAIKKIAEVSANTLSSRTNMSTEMQLDWARIVQRAGHDPRNLDAVPLHLRPWIMTEGVAPSDCKHHVIWRVGDCIGKSTVFGRLLRCKMPGVTLVGHWGEEDNKSSAVPHLNIDQIEAALPKWLAGCAERPDVVIVIAGIIDLDMSKLYAPLPVEEIGAKMVSLLRAISGLLPDARIFLVGPLAAFGQQLAERAERLPALRAYYRSLPGVTYIEADLEEDDIVPNDGIHPMPSGYRKVANAIVAHLT